MNSVEKYKFIKILGRVFFSVVKLAKDKSTGEKFAIKIIEKNQIKNIENESRILFEKSINKIIEHMNIIKTKGILKIQKKYI